jgi:hypothetical protein
MKSRVMPDGQSVELYADPDDTNQFKRILSNILPDVIERFSSKNKEYGDNATHDLGVAAQFVDIYRKVIKLRRALWDGEPEVLVSEPVDEVIDDLIAHLLLAKDELAESHHGPGYSHMQYDETAQLIREAKGGPETWVDRDRVLSPPPDYHGQHAYTIGSMDETGHLVVSVKGHSIQQANDGDERCQWKIGDHDGPAPLAQCVGIADHDEDYHINQFDQAWSV